MDCIFCKIINNEIPSYTIYEDEKVKVFLDVNPKSCGHCLIIPKTHFKDLEDIDLNILTHIMEVAKQINNKLELKLNINGLQLVQNNGEIQEVKHFHLHLIPYYKETKELSLEECFNLLKD